MPQRLYKPHFNNVGFALQRINQNRGRGRGGNRGRGRNYRQNQNRSRGRGQNSRQNQNRGQRGRGRGHKNNRKNVNWQSTSARISNEDASIDLPMTEEIELIKRSKQQLPHNSIGYPQISKDQSFQGGSKSMSRKQLRAAKWRQKQNQQRYSANNFSHSFEVRASNAGWNPNELVRPLSMGEFMHAQMVDSMIQQELYKPVLLGPIKAKRLSYTGQNFEPRTQKQIEADEKREDQLRQKKFAEFKRNEQRLLKQQEHLYKQRQRARERQEKQKKNISYKSQDNKQKEKIKNKHHANIKNKNFSNNLTDDAVHNNYNQRKMHQKANTSPRSPSQFSKKSTSPKFKKKNTSPKFKKNNLSPKLKKKQKYTVNEQYRF